MNKDFAEKEKNDRESIDKSLIEFKKLKSSEIEELISEIKQSDYKTSELTKLYDEIQKRDRIREAAIGQSFYKKASWGLPFPILKHNIDSKLSFEDYKYLICYVKRIMFWKFDLSFSWFLNRTSITLVREINPKPEIPKPLSRYNPIIITQLGANGNVLIKCKSKADILYDSESNYRSLQLFLAAFYEIARIEQIEI